jgi:thiol-disulfide isomerase/thioredoxin
MMSISLGPLALPVAPLVLLASVAVAGWLAATLVRRHAARHNAGAGLGDSAPAANGDTASNTVWLAAAAALLAARTVHVLLNLVAYGATPLAVLDLRDGGWHAPTAWAVGAAWLLWRGWRTPPLRRALAAAAVSGLLLWLGLHAALGTRDRPAMPAVALSPVAPASAPGSAATLVQAAAGRPVVVNLWATWCAPCRQEMPVFAAAQAQHTDIGFLFVNQGENAATVQAYLARERLPLREVWLDAASALGPAVGSAGLPTTLFYNASGRLVDAHFGVLNAAALRSRLQALRNSP